MKAHAINTMTSPAGEYMNAGEFVKRNREITRKRKRNNLKGEIEGERERDRKSSWRFVSDPQRLSWNERKTRILETFYFSSSDNLPRKS